MTTSQFSSFPPISEPVAALRQSLGQPIDWIKVRRMCRTSWDTVVTAAIWAAAVLTVVIQMLGKAWARCAPTLAAVMRHVSERIDPATAPLFAPITAADIDTMDRLELFKTLRANAHIPACEDTGDVNGIQASELMTKTKAELMKLAGVKSRGYTKEQLVARLQHGPASQSK